MTQYIGITQHNEIKPTTTLRDILYNNEFHIGILDDIKQSAVAKTFHIQGIPYKLAGASLDPLHSPADLNQIVQFIQSHVDDLIGVQLICEIPSTQFPQDTPLLTLLLLLNRLGCCTHTFSGDQVDDPQKPISIGMMPPEERRMIEAHLLSMMTPETKAQVQRRGGKVIGSAPLFLATGVTRAYTDFLLGKQATLTQSAVGAAIVGMKPSTHTYLFSSGRVQSAQDIVIALQQSARQPTTSVLSASEIYTQHCIAETITEKLDKIALEYAVTMQKYKYLGEREGLKLALLAVSKKWKIELYCRNMDQQEVSYSLADEAQDHPEVRPEFLVYSPRGVYDSWVLPLLERVPA